MAHEAQPGLLARGLAEQPGLGVGGLSQVEASRRFDRLLPVRYTMDGNTDFQENVLPSLIQPGTIIYDAGAAADLISASR